MNIKNHPDYDYEYKRLQLTKEYIEYVLDKTEDNKDTYKSNIRQAMEDLDFLDSSQSYINILTNAKFLEIAEKNYTSLNANRKKPYFSRIDFQLDGSEEPEKIYIGKTSLFRTDNQQPLIVDWRSPVANMYYESRVGGASYTTESGKIEGKLLLKRQYTIEDGWLESFRDVDVTARDELLQDSLGVNSEKRLRDIVATIQAEQNRVIRAELHTPLIVQGVAGSGKTTIALHRIAYLIYTYAERFNPESFMILAPNRLFLNYIADVLPELGADKVRQTTFIDFVQSVVGRKYKLMDTEEKLHSFLSSAPGSPSGDSLKRLAWESKFLGSASFKEAVEDFFKQWEQNYLSELDFKLLDTVIYSASDIKRLFLHDYKYLPVFKRVDQIRKVLQNHLKIKKKQMLHETGEHYDDLMESAQFKYRDANQRSQKIGSLMSEKEAKLAKIEKDSCSTLKRFMESFKKWTVFGVYECLFQDPQYRAVLSQYISDSEALDYICTRAMERLNNKSIMIEDTGALLYLQSCLFDVKERTEIKNVVIDEAQDYSYFQFFALRTFLDTNLFTVFGDLAQSIHAYRAIHDWEEVKQAFEPVPLNYVELETSYRTTVEIMDLANEVLKQGPDAASVSLAKPVIRHGRKPTFASFTDRTELLRATSDWIDRLQKDGMASIAVIGKTLRDCKTIYKALHQASVDAVLVDGKDDFSPKQIQVVPSYVAKGLEFDAVIIACVDEAFEINAMDTRLLYVSLTRPLHRLHIFSVENKCPLINKINKQFFG